MWVLKFGAMADILSKEEEGRDIPRATYCRKRYEEGLKLMTVMPWLSQATIDGVVVDTPAVAAADRWSYEWQSNPAAIPGIVVGGIDFFAVRPIPTSTVSVGMTVVQNAPIPANTPTAPVFLPRDAMDAVENEAVHLALLKMGGGEFSESIKLHQDFEQFCAITRSRMGVEGIFPSDYTPVIPKQYEQQAEFGKGK
jgi:hypothetical protein